MAWNGGNRTQWLPPVGGNTNPASLRYLNENRAGDGGYIIRQGKYLIRQDTGTRFKIRGTHLIWQDICPSTTDAPQIAQTMADLGYNYVRVNGDEKLRSTSSSGFWFDTAAADYMTFDTTADPNNFLRLWDNFSNELTKVGIYKCLCLYDIKPYPAAQRPVAYQSDTWPGPGNYGKGIHILPLNVTRAQTYLSNLLTRPNSVTGIAPINDPSYSDVYLINESSVTQAWYQTSNNFQPSALTGQARADMIARWSNYAQNIYTPAQAAQTEMLSPNATPWGAAPTFDAASSDLQKAFMAWMEYEDKTYAQTMYDYLRSIGWKAVIRISTANYTPISTTASDCLTSHIYGSSAPSGGNTLATTNTTRTAGSNIVTVASATGIVVGASVQNVSGMGVDSYVTNVAGLNITLDKPATSNGTTSTTFSAPYKCAPLNFPADHTAGFYSTNFTQVRDWNRPFIVDEIGLTAATGDIGLIGAGYFPYHAVLAGLHDTDGYAHFSYLSPQSYPAPGYNNNTYAYSSLHGEKAIPTAMLGVMVLNLLFEKGYMSRLTREIPMKINSAALNAAMVAGKTGTVFCLPTGIVGASQNLQARVGLDYSPNGIDQTGSTLASLYPSAINFSGAGVQTTITGEKGDKYTWNRSRDGGTFIIHESPYDLVYFGILPTSFTSAINGITINFPVTYTGTCSTTSGSNVIDVNDASAWNIGDYVAIAGGYFVASNPQRIARVADIDTGLNKLTLVTEGGNTGIIAAPVQQTLAGVAITRPQWGSFVLASMDGSTLGNGPALLVTHGDSYPMEFKLLSNSEYANSNAVTLPNIKNLGANSRPYIDLVVGKVTMPSNVSVNEINSDGGRTTIARKTTTFGLGKGVVYLVNNI